MAPHLGDLVHGLRLGLQLARCHHRRSDRSVSRGGHPLRHIRLDIEEPKTADGGLGQLDSDVVGTWYRRARACYQSITLMNMSTYLR